METYISWGAGVNSTAIIALHLLSEFEPRPEIVFADTGAELPETYQYIEEVRKILAEHDWDVTILNPRDHAGFYRPSVNSRDLYQFQWDTKTVPSIRFRQCTSKYKRDPLKRYAEGRTAMIGICADELHRIRDDGIYPVKDLTRAECAALIEKAGLPEAHKTGCWFCPMQAKYEWMKLWEKHRDLYDKALALERRSKITYNKDGTLDLVMDRWLAERDFLSKQLTFAFEKGMENGKEETEQRPC